MWPCRSRVKISERAVGVLTGGMSQRGVGGTLASTCQPYHVSGAGIMKQEAPVIDHMPPDHVSPPLSRIAMFTSSTCAIASCQLQSLLLRPEVVTRTRLATKSYATTCVKPTCTADVPTVVWCWLLHVAASICDGQGHIWAGMLSGGTGCSSPMNRGSSWVWLMEDCVFGVGDRNIMLTLPSCSVTAGVDPV